MDFYILLKSQMLRSSFMRRLLFRAFAFGLVMLVFSILQIAHEVKMEPQLLNNEKCSLDFGSDSCDCNVTKISNPLSFWLSLFGVYPMACKESTKLNRNVFEELMRKNLLTTNAITLCVGAGSASAMLALGELGFSNALGVNRHPFFSLLRRRFVYELDYVDGHFDFVFSKALDRVSVPALLVLEVERVLRPGGIGAMLVGGRELYSGSLIRSAASVSSFLKSSDVVHVCGIGFHTVVIFKKRFKDNGLFENFELPDDCPAIKNNKPFIKLIEPLVGEKSLKPGMEFSYLPNFMDISSRNRLIYVNVGVEESTNLNVSELFKPYNSMIDHVFSVYLIDHNASVLSSHVRNPGITFIYHPDLAEYHSTQETNPDEYLTAPQDDDDDDDGYSDEYLSAPWDDVGFDFIHWFKDTVEDNDFVVLRINSRSVKYSFISELFRAGVLCHVDELFLHCSENVDCQGSVCGYCMNLLQSLRNSGIFVHQWLGD